MGVVRVGINRDKVLADIEKKLSGGVDASNDTFILMSSSVYLLEEVWLCTPTHCIMSFLFLEF